MLNPISPIANDNSGRRPAFTLVELMVTITIIAIVSSMVLYGMSGVQTTAKNQRTKSQIARIHELIAEKWESYETRRIRSVSGAAGVSAQFPPLERQRHPELMLQIDRLVGLRELQRLEMPDRISDVDPNLALTQIAPGQFTTRSNIPRPMLNIYYASRMSPNWTPAHQGAECLYLILSKIQVGDTSALEMFSDRDFGDVDGDGMQEILDAWGNPISFIRWPAGFTGPSIMQDGTTNKGPDTLDLAGADLRNNDDVADNDTYTIFPLVFSSGADGVDNIYEDVAVGQAETLVYRDTDRTGYNVGLSSFSPRVRGAFTSDPFVRIPINGGYIRLGQVENGGDEQHLDNIYNHALDTKLN